MISNRQSKLLKLIVDEYIKTARPVGSVNLCEVLDCSSATVRSEMAELEDLGYLEKTHTSSGRVPSEKGYRYYVDNLMSPKEMTGEDMLKLQTIFHNQSLQISDVITKSMELISEITNYTSIVLGSNSKENRLKQIEVIPISETKLITIVITDKGHVEHKQLDMPYQVSLNEVKKTVELINNLLVGTPIDEVSGKLEFEIKPIIGKYVKQHEVLYNAFYKAFNDFTNKNNIHLLGKTNFLKQPEFNNVDKMRDIISKFEDENIVRYMEEEDNGINIYIGKENELDEDMTIIKTKYRSNEEEGTIAIIGPKRMEYEKVVSLLEYIKENIER
jgi:heat-inducible transcriptional repressor